MLLIHASFCVRHTRLSEKHAKTFLRENGVVEHDLALGDSIGVIFAPQHVMAATGKNFLIRL
jgi:hypothetical protein